MKRLSIVTAYAHHDVAEYLKGGFVQRFHRDTCFYTELLNSLLRKIRVESQDPRVMVVFSHETKSETMAHPAAGVVYEFDFEKYTSLESPAEMEGMLVRSIKDSLIDIGSLREWDCQGLKQLFQAANERGNRLSGLSKKAWKSPRGAHKARIGFEMHVNRVVVFGELFKGRKGIAKVVMGSFPPEIGCYSEICDSAKWIDHHTLHASSSSFAKQQWTADFSSFLQ